MKKLILALRVFHAKAQRSKACRAPTGSLYFFAPLREI
jgi:hypothetical protein